MARFLCWPFFKNINEIININNNINYQNMIITMKEGVIENWTYELRGLDLKYILNLQKNFDGLMWQAVLELGFNWQ